MFLNFFYNKITVNNARTCKKARLLIYGFHPLKAETPVSCRKRVKQTENTPL